ncbi:MAG: protein kinase [Thermoanaerobaculia bacterium]
MSAAAPGGTTRLFLRPGEAEGMGLAAGAKLGPYEIVAPLGAGGMGEVYRAHDTRLGREVALKVLPGGFLESEEGKARFEREAHALAALSHPNIAVVYAFEEIPGSPGSPSRHLLAMELLEGGTLREALAKGPLPLRKALDVALQVAEGLAAAHGKGIVHRDVKPENVFLTKDGHAKLLDFGLARHDVTLHDPADTRSPTLAALSEKGVVLGTVAYMSPEQARGETVDFRSDQFSLGTVLYEMLTGKRPFKGASAAETVAAIIRDEPEPVAKLDPKLPAPLGWIVQRSLSKDPDERYSSTRDLAKELQSLRSHLSEAVSATAVAPGEAPRLRRRVSLWAMAGATLLAVALTVAVILSIVSRKRMAVTSGLPGVLALPCTVYGAPEVAFLTDAVPGTISTLLSQVDGLDTKVPPTSLEVEKVKGDLGRLAEMYQVSSFIVTSITASPGRFDLNVQLVDAATRRVRWGKQYEGAREAYNDLARQAAEGIRLAVKPAASPVPTTTVSSEIELALREGAYFSNRYNNLHHPPDFDAAVAAFRRALQSDASLAAAAGQIARLYLFKFEAEGEASVALKEMEAWSRRALEVDRRCGEAWAMLSWVESYATKPDVERQLEYALKAASYSPRDALSHQTVSNSVGYPGAASLALAAGQEAVELDPFYVYASEGVATCLSLLGRSEEALPIADRAMRVEPDAGLCPETKGYVLMKLGRLEEARKLLARYEPQFFANPGPPLSQAWGQIRFQLAVAERDAAMIEKLQRYLLPPLLDGKANANTLEAGTTFVCPGLARLGRTDDSIRILLRSVEVGVPPPCDWLLLDPDIQLLRGDPRFAKVLAASRDGAAKIARILGEARTRGELPKYLETPLDELLRLLKEKGTKSW